jgi:hypothetical protein
MERKTELETQIREAYRRIHMLEGDAPERGRQWERIKTCLREYIPLCEKYQAGIVSDILQIIARLPEYADQVRDSVFRQAGGDLYEVLKEEGLAEPQQAAETINASIPAGRNMIFDSGLCAGYPLVASPGEYFVAQEFSVDRDDLLRALEVAFGGFDLKPYRADKDILPGHLLCKIAAKIQTTRFSVFELTRSQNRNVYLELGIAIGLGRPFVLVKESDSEVSPMVQGLDYYTIRSYFALQKELGSSARQYLLNITMYKAPELPAAGSTASYIIAHGDWDMPPDFCIALASALRKYNLRPVLIGADSGDVVEALEGAGLECMPLEYRGDSRLDATTRAIQAARFGVYRVDRDCGPDSFQALGIAIGLNRPWLLASRERSPLPSDVKGLNVLEFSSFTELGKQFPKRFAEFLDRFV